MALKLSAQDKADIWVEANASRPPVKSPDCSETRFEMPAVLGSGYHREIPLHPGLELNIFSKTYRDVTVSVPENEHLVQFEVFLSGIVDSGDFLYQDDQWGYVGSSGIQRSFNAFYPESQTIAGIDIHIQPQLLSQLFPTDDVPPLVHDLIQADRAQTVFSPRTTQEIRTVVKQIMNCSFVGLAKQFYLQGKVFELIGLQLDGLAQLQNQAVASTPSLKPDTVDRIQAAAEILRSQLENPPTQQTLAQQVGISDRTLQKGFKALFGVTPFVYLTQQRMARAECLLREPGRTVAEVANWVGYTNPAQFAAAFKRQFGILPSACKQGRKSIRSRFAMK